MLTVIGIMGVAFAYSMFLETQSTRQFISTLQARYLAEGGVGHAWGLLDEDALGSRVDDWTETWADAPSGADTDVDGDGTPEARWWPVADGAGETFGRYAMRITDEAGKVNLLTAEAEPSPFGVGGVNLTTLLEQAGFEDAEAVAQAIEGYRYGADARPGVGLVDDDGDGAVDEVDEYQPLALRGDDRLLEGLEDLAAIADLSAEEVGRLSRFATVYSWDLNVSVTGKARVNVNTATAEQLFTVLLEAGVEDPWQAAVNLADYADPDVQMSSISKSSQALWLSDQGLLGSWSWTAGDPGAYTSREADGAPLSWSSAVPEGTFHVRALGLPGSPLGDLTLDGTLKPSLESGSYLGLFTFSATQPVSVAVTCRAPGESGCAFRGLELVPEGAAGGTVIRGIEAVRFNEVMVEPRIEFDVASATFDSQGSDWACPVGAGVCSNSGVGQARWSWTSELVPAGRYYVRVYGTAAGQTVGQVRVEAITELLVHGQAHPTAILVGTDGKFTVTLGKTASQGTYYFKKIELSVQPDAEYVELSNLTDQAVDVSGWTIEGRAAGGRVARLPAGSVIPAHGLLVAAVDLSDTQTGLSGNGIDARSSWEIPEAANAVQLEFPGGAPSPDDDWLKTTVADGASAQLALRNGSWTVDEVAYPLPLITRASFQSLEKADPSVIVDDDGDGLDEGWYPSLKLYTAGVANDNDGLREVQGLELVIHDPSEEVTVLNRPLGGVGELAGLPSGQAWKPFASGDLAKVVDRLTVEGLRLEAEGALMESGEGWEEQAEGAYVHTDPALADVAGRWRWTGLFDGAYWLSLFGQSGEQFAVRWEQADGQLTEWSPALSADAQGRVVIGQVTIGADGTPTETLVLEVRCASLSGICHFDHVRLDPLLVRVGPININTAPLEVLRAMPGMTDAVASRFIAGRPYGDQDQKGRGIGDLLVGDVLGTTEEDKLAVFRRLGHLVTTRSDMFQILSLGQQLEDGRAGASQRVQTIIQRSR